jgi:hypothetical protein
MANIVVTSDAVRIFVEFNDLAGSPDINTKRTTYPRATLAQVSEPFTELYLIVKMVSGDYKEEWCVAHDAAPGVLPIDSVDGVTPTDLDHLYSLLGALII